MRGERMADQAAGLRKLLAQSATRVLTVAGAQAGLGATSLVVNLSFILARDGKQVLLLDENLAHDNAGNVLALRPRYDLLHAVRRDKPLRDVLLHAAPRVRVLPVARAMQALPRLAAQERNDLLTCLAEASHGVDVVLVDAATVGPRFISANLAPEQPLLLVINGTPSSITESYALIKRMAQQDGRKNFGIVVNKVQQANDARNLFENLAQVARRHLDVGVEYLGYVPHESLMLRATQLRRPLFHDFPDSPAAQALDELAQGLLSLPVPGAHHASLPQVVQRLMRSTQNPDWIHAG